MDAATFDFLVSERSIIVEKDEFKDEEALPTLIDGWLPSWLSGLFLATICSACVLSCFSFAKEGRESPVAGIRRITATTTCI